MMQPMGIPPSAVSTCLARWIGRPLPTASNRAKVAMASMRKEKASMDQAHHRDRSGEAQLPSAGRRIRRIPQKVEPRERLDFLASQPPCVVAMEACGSAHHWGREAEKLGHEVKLVPPIYVKPFVKRQKNDMADAEATTEAAQRPTMSFVAVKTEEQQARGMLFRTRDLLVRQRTQTINALRGHLAEFGSTTGACHVSRLGARGSVLGATGAGPRAGRPSA